MCSDMSVGREAIWEIMMIEFPDRELIYPSGKHSGFPDMGSSMIAGFYYERERAVEALHENALDIRETIYDAAFLLRRYPGLYQAVGKDGRTYFLWDAQRGGFYEAEEPDIFRHIAL